MNCHEGLETKWGWFAVPVAAQAVAGFLLPPSLVVHATHLGVQRPVETPVGATGRALFNHVRSEAVVENVVFGTN